MLAMTDALATLDLSSLPTDVREVLLAQQAIIRTEREAREQGNRPIDPAFCILCGFRTLIAGMSAGGEYLEIRTTGR
jgi:hypothetical protein